MEPTTPYRMAARETQRVSHHRENTLRSFRAVAGAVAIGLGVNGAIDYLDYDKKLDESRKRVEFVRNASEDLREEGLRMQTIGDYYQRDIERTIGFGRLVGMHRICTKYDGAVAIRLIEDQLAIREIEQIRREFRIGEIVLRRFADQIEIDEVLPNQKRVGNSMIYVGLAGLVASALYGTRKREEQE